ncbi:ABC transporter permease [Fictibacillus aquaticus]|uniref:ABC3 transporter permease C-terminal domain-containing protein n=1 Tax=Fictibacillus aquaticus TaxID=2021314 RepID=A0A235F552_9BACL|nr:ABC transporter permease [Fictibacillus aquaticus]OYD56379.1 hypothetical protein CGZ90_17650 [Fictibacillus aquaticus]
MIKFILQNWRRQRERFLLLLAGAVMISGGLSYLLNLSEGNKGTVVENLQKRWESSYHIVVRPQGSRSVTEEKGLLEPNYLSGIAGGISQKQLSDIKAITDVEVAAPVAVLGYSPLEAEFKTQIMPKEFGIYRIKIQNRAFDGVRHTIEDRDTLYVPLGKWNMPEGYGGQNGIQFGKDFGLMDQYDWILRASSQQLLVGIDPVEEAKLVGLDAAVLQQNGSQYFSPQNSDVTKTSDVSTAIPVLISSAPFVDETITYTVEPLDLPFQDINEAAQTLAKIKENGGKKYLNSLATNNDAKKTYDISSEKLYKTLFGSLTGLDPATGKKVSLLDGQSNITESHVALKSTALSVKSVTSPFGERWAYAFKAEPQKAEFPWGGKIHNAFRPLDYYELPDGGVPGVSYNFVGFYDPNKLKLSKDPLNELPMETYRPATAHLVLDGKGKPVNPQVTVQPTSNPLGYLTAPPTLLTTIEAAAAINGDKPISSVRIKVAGVTSLSEESQNKLEAIAKEIESKTGLLTDITLGSSPQPLILEIPKNGNTQALGWIEQPWSKLQSSITLFRETKLGYSAVIVFVLLVAVVYVFASCLVSLLSRRKQMAVLLSLGWRPSQLSRMIMMESIILGCVTAIIAWSITAITAPAEISLVKLMLIGFTGITIYLLGSIWPAMLVRKIKPYEAMRTGEITVSSKRVMRTKNLWSLALSHFLGKWNRNFLSVLSIAIPATLLSIFVSITLRLQGIMYTTWLGQYISVEIGKVHYIAMGIAFCISILTTSEILWQNIAERRNEIALLKAIGWRSSTVRRLIWLEGLYSGGLASLISVLLSSCVMYLLYGGLTLSQFGLMLGCSLIPLVMGFLGSVLPAESAIKVEPNRGLAS